MSGYISLMSALAQAAKKIKGEPQQEPENTIYDEGSKDKRLKLVEKIYVLEKKLFSLERKGNEERYDKLKKKIDELKRRL